MERYSSLEPSGSGSGSAVQCSEVGFVYEWEMGGRVGGWEGWGKWPALV